MIHLSFKSGRGLFRGACTFRFLAALALLSGALAFTGCAPKVYVIERTTVLEEEAAGSWPDLEARWKKANVKTAPQAVKTDESSQQQKRLTRSLEPDSLKQ